MILFYRFSLQHAYSLKKWEENRRDWFVVWKKALLNNFVWGE